MMTMAKLRHYFIICYVNLRAAKVCVKYFGFDFEVAPAEAEVEAEVPSSRFPVSSCKSPVVILIPLARISQPSEWPKNQ